MPALCRHPHSKTYNFTGRGFEPRRFSACLVWPGVWFGLLCPVGSADDAIKAFVDGKGDGTSTKNKKKKKK